MNDFKADDIIAIRAIWNKIRFVSCLNLELMSPLDELLEGSFRGETSL